jgi:hypothetical protein
VAQILCEEGSEVDAPLAERLVAELSTALVEQFVHVTVTGGEVVIKPDGVLDDGHRKAVAVRLGVRHGGSASPDTIEATQTVT